MMMMMMMVVVVVVVVMLLADSNNAEVRIYFLRPQSLPLGKLLRIFAPLDLGKGEGEGGSPSFTGGVEVKLLRSSEK